jgi:exodeoxyribonuclease VII small subunit
LRFELDPLFYWGLFSDSVRFDISIMAAKKNASKAKAGDTDDQLSFEDALGALEELVSEMEEKEMPLDTMIANYEKGVRLRGFCERHIEDAQFRIERIRESGALSLKGDSKVTLEAFEAADEQAGTTVAVDAKTQTETGGDDGELF